MGWETYPRAEDDGIVTRALEVLDVVLSSIVDLVRRERGRLVADVWRERDGRDCKLGGGRKVAEGSKRTSSDPGVVAERNGTVVDETL